MFTLKKTLTHILSTTFVFCSTSGLAANPPEDNHKAVELSILHINDHHSYLEPHEARILLNGKETKVNIGGFSAVNSKLNELRKKYKNPLVLHAGDAITGTLYFTLFGGSADAAVMNAGNFHYFTLGNHEFDAGNEGLLKLLEPLKIPVLSANVIPDKGSILYNKWKPYDIFSVNGENIGIIGLDTVNKTVNSSSPGKDVKFYDEIATAQIMANALKAQGVNKIILLSHAGSEKNIEIAQKVNDIDIIVTGDSHYLYGNDELRELKLPVVYEYPLEFKSPNGEPVFVMEAWAYSAVVGDLGVKFSKDGIASIIRKTPHVLMSTNKLKVKNNDGNWQELSGEERQKAIQSLQKMKSVSLDYHDKKTDKLISKYRYEKDQLAKEVIGSIVGQAMPGGSDNRIPNKAGSNPEGSVATRFVAETMYNELKNVDLVIQNAGGVRSDILPGDVTFNDAYTFLPFGNTLFTYKMEGSLIKQALEDALQFALVDGSTGGFPYGAGVRYEANETPNADGKRLVSVEVFNKQKQQWEDIDDNKRYLVGTNSYIASGKDGYKTFGHLFNDPKYEGTDTYLPDAESFIKFMKKNPRFEAFTTSNVKFNAASEALPKK
ncbi:NAD nucleotidase [Aggregatibacter aphrophilus]|jgi:NAD nucleotidase|uniref:NAD nucleotidase n=1 Tax=Aggregatibacter aphrophilus TaxID=732 RepID=UPI000D6E824A|nr:NAD nucleotidase [Aggregatibacter aphrophilus]RDE90538.1 NAD nucleotidase [Aggregatibacter aphrophilus]SQI94482.1 Probable 5'-nucleotidase precursor [Aggregatibacter aphrophilus]